MPLIEFRSVSRRYRLGETIITALREVSLAIEPGEFLAVGGPSGSGKSTLCHLAGAIDLPDSGEVRVNGASIADMREDALAAHRARSVGFVFQSFNLVAVLNAEENVELPLLLRGEAAGPSRAAARQLLERLGLGTHLRHRPDKLSGGQRQRVAIARALIGDAPLVVADEPTANLDSTTAGQILDIMREFNRERGTTFLFSSHDPRLLERADRRILLRDGRISDAA